MEHSPISHLWMITLTALVAGAVCASAMADEVEYGVASWPEKMGNHRARVRVGAKADAVRAHIPWRRHDASPQDRNIVVLESANGKQVANVARPEVTREYGDIIFQPDEPGEPGILIHATPVDALPPGMRAIVLDPTVPLQCAVAAHHDLSAGDAILFRPDQHVAARLRGATAGSVYSAWRHATGRSPT